MRRQKGKPLVLWTLQYSNWQGRSQTWIGRDYPQGLCLQGVIGKEKFPVVACLKLSLFLRKRIAFEALAWYIDNVKLFRRNEKQNPRKVF
jgi:hypothetical protein